MSKDKNPKDQPLNTEETTTTVVEAHAKNLKFVNPYIQAKIYIYGLDPYQRTGLRANTMKTARAWVRARGLNVRLAHVIKEETPNGGDPFTPEDGDGPVTPDLIVYRFTEECLIENGVEVIVPKGRIVNKKAVVEAEAVEPVLASEVTEVTEVAEDTTTVSEIAEIAKVDEVDEVSDTAIKDW